MDHAAAAEQAGRMANGLRNAADAADELGKVHLGEAVRVAGFTVGFVDTTEGGGFASVASPQARADAATITRTAHDYVADLLGPGWVETADGAGHVANLAALHDEKRPNRGAGPNLGYVITFHEDTCANLATRPALDPGQACPDCGAVAVLRRPCKIHRDVRCEGGCPGRAA